MRKLMTVLILLGLLMSLQVPLMLAQAPPQPGEEVGDPTSTPVPTEEVVVDPTEEPTAEPTTEGEPAPDEEISPGAPPLPPEGDAVTIGGETEAVGAGEIGWAADVGEWNSQMIGFVNLGDDTAESVIKLYDSSTTPSATIDLPNMNVGTGYVMFPADETSFPEGTFSAIVDSTSSLGAVVLNTNYTLGGGDMYRAFDSGSNSLTAALLYRYWTPTGSRWTSRIHVQNTETSDATVYLNLYRSGSVSPDVVKVDTITGYSTKTYDMDSTDYDAFGEYFGYGVFTSTNMIAVVVDALRSPTGATAGDRVVTTYEAQPSEDAGRDLVAPLIYSNHSSWLTGVNVVNVGTISTTVTMTVTKSGPSEGDPVGTTYTFERGIDAGAEDTFYMPDLWPEGLPNPLYGTAQLHSSDSDIVSVVSSSKQVSNGSVGNISAALNPDTATSKIASPFYFKRYGGSDWITGANIWNTGDATTVTVTLVKDPDSPGDASVVWSQDVDADSPVTFYSIDSVIPTGWFGSAFVTSTDNRDLLAVFTHSGYDKGVSTNNIGINY